MTIYTDRGALVMPSAGPEGERRVLRSQVVQPSTACLGRVVERMAHKSVTAEGLAQVSGQSIAAICWFLAGNECRADLLAAVCAVCDCAPELAKAEARLAPAAVRKGTTR